MNRLTPITVSLDSILLDQRLRFFRKYVTILLRRVSRLAAIRDNEGVESLHRELLTALVDERNRSERLFGDEPFLLMCGITDEILQESDWFGREWWKEHLLEREMFGSRTVGDKFYAILDRVLVERRQNELPLAVILLDSLALGFRGRLAAGAGDDVRRKHYRDELGSWIQNAIETENTTEKHAGQAVPANDREKAYRTIPSLAGWFVFAALAVSVLLVVSHLIWRQNVEPLHDLLESRTASATASPGEGEK